MKSKYALSELTLSARILCSKKTKGSGMDIIINK